MRVLALDISTACGFAFDGADPQAKPRTGVWRVPASAAGDYGTMGLALQRWLRGLVGMSGADLLAYEAPLVRAGSSFAGAPTNAETVRIQLGFTMAAQIVAAERNLRVAAAAVQTIRKHFCGSGHAKKPEVMARCRMLGWDFADNNAADAAACWSWAKSQFDKAYRPHQVTELFAKVPA
ncbi:MAG TPA: hypothetical protein VEA35_00490 [Ramlibacter sp.]|nr:hypothetical protein [Ramlibacter sp.]